MSFMFSDQVQEIDLDEFTRVEYDSFKTPWFVAVPFLFPTNEKLGIGLEQAIQNCVNMHKTQLTIPSLYLNKVVERDSGRIVGGAIWKAVSPTDMATKPEARWHPEGSDRDAANAAVQMSSTNYTKWFKDKPHLFLQIMFVHPDFRRQGVASLILDWGLKLADERGWQIFLNAAKMAVPLYEKHGFHAFGESVLSFDHLEETERLTELRKLYLPHSSWPMVRPVGGVYKQGTDELPWEVSEVSRQ